MLHLHREDMGYWQSLILVKIPGTTYHELLYFFINLEIICVVKVWCNDTLFLDAYASLGSTLSLSK